MIKNKDVKKRIIEISYKLKLSHIGSCITAVDIIDEIYKTKKSDEKFVLSAGHAHLAHLMVMDERDPLHNWVEVCTRVENLIKKYGIHCDREAGCDVSSGSLGHGIGITVGMALADRNKNVYCLLSDGEMAEGSVWEALRIASELKLKNLKIYLNSNGWGAYKETDEDNLQRDLERFMVQLDFKHITTDMNDYPDYLQGQLAHYKVLDKAEYEEVMEILK